MIIIKEREDLEVFSLIIATIFGSFLNVLIYRIPKNISLLKPSFCINCNNKIKWFENIPLISYIFLRGKCSYCKNKISKRYFLVEFISLFLATILLFKFSLTLDFFIYLCLIYILIVLSFIDFEYKAVPSYLLLFALIISFFAAKTSFLQSLQNASIFAGFFILLEFILTFYVQNIKSKLLNDEKLKSQKALGEGDIPIVAIIGVTLGLHRGIIAIFLAGVFAIIPSIFNTLVKQNSQVAFIPFLVMGFLFELFLNIL